MTFDLAKRICRVVSDLTSQKLPLRVLKITLIEALYNQQLLALELNVPKM